MKTGKLITNNPVICPCCNSSLDGFTGEKSIPTEGSLSVCVYCSTMLVFKGKGMNIRLEKMTDKEIEDLKNDAPDAYQQLQFYISRIKLMHKKN